MQAFRSEQHFFDINNATLSIIKTAKTVKVYNQ